MSEKFGGPWREKEQTFVKRAPGEYRPGKSKRDASRGHSRRELNEAEEKQTKGKSIK